MLLTVCKVVIQSQKYKNQNDIYTLKQELHIYLTRKWFLRNECISGQQDSMYT